MIKYVKKCSKRLSGLLFFVCVFVFVQESVYYIAVFKISKRLNKRLHILLNL